MIIVLLVLLAALYVSVGGLVSACVPWSKHERRPGWNRQKKVYLRRGLLAAAWPLWFFTGTDLFYEVSNEED